MSQSGISPESGKLEGTSVVAAGDSPFLYKGLPGFELPLLFLELNKRVTVTLFRVFLQSPTI